MLRTNLLIVAIAILFLNCNKDKSDLWTIDNTSLTDGCLLPACICEFSDQSIYFLDTSCSGLVFEQIQGLRPLLGNDELKSIVIQIPNINSNEFEFNDLEIYDELKCEVSTTIGAAPSYYKIKKGQISGIKARNGDWEIFYDVYFGGNDNMKYEINSDASY